MVCHHDKVENGVENGVPGDKVAFQIMNTGQLIWGGLQLAELKITGRLVD